MRRVKIFGDSHSVYFKKSGVRHWSTSYPLREYETSCRSFDGGSIKGLGRLRSTLRIRDVIMSAAEESDVIVLCFGQVDIELGFFYVNLVKKIPTSFQSHCEALIESYESLIDELKAVGCTVCVKGANLPVLLDRESATTYVARIIKRDSLSKQEKDEIHQELMASFPDIMERISFTRYFNTTLRSATRDWGVQYFDINEEIANPMGVVHPAFIRADHDHHLIDSLEVRLIHQKALADALDRSMFRHA